MRGAAEHLLHLQVSNLKIPINYIVYGNITPPIYHSINSSHVQWPMSQVTTCDRRGVTDTRMWHFFCHIFSCTCYTFRCHISKSPYIIYCNIFEYLAEYACGVLDGVVSIFNSCRKWPDIAFEWIAVLCYAICDGFCCLGLRIWHFQILAIVTGFLAEGAACSEPGGSIPLNRPIQLAICSPRLEPPNFPQE